MTDVASTAMRRKLMAGLFAVAVAISMGSPAFATPLARHDAPCHACKQAVEPCDYRAFGTCPRHQIDTPHLNGGHAMHDDRPANMILG